MIMTRRVRRNLEARRATVRLLMGIGAVIGLVVACDRGDGARAAAGDSTALVTDSAGARTAAATGDADVRGDFQFATAMADHHLQLIGFLDTIEYRLRSPVAQQDAAMLRQRQAAEHTRLLAALGARGAGGGPAVPRDEALTQGGSTSQEPAQSMRDRDGGAVDKGPPVDGAFYDFVIAHHRAGLDLIEGALPTLEDAALRGMASAMRDDHRREIADFERKRTRLRG